MGVVLVGSYSLGLNGWGWDWIVVVSWTELVGLA